MMESRHKMEETSINNILTSGEKNLALVQPLIAENDRLYITCYTNQGTFLATTYPIADAGIYDSAFRIFGGMEKALRYAADRENRKPILIGTSIGMQWGIVLSAERHNSIFFAVGPVFYGQPNKKNVQDALLPYLSSIADPAWPNTFLSRISSFPVLSYAIFSRYVVLIHNTLSADRLGSEDLFDYEKKSTFHASGKVLRDRTQIYQSEKALLDMVRKGNINYKSALRQSVQLSPGVPVKGMDPLRQAKTSIVVFITLVSRAAMEGGLSPEVAYPLGDSYIQQVEDCRDSGELTALSGAMYHDFVYRVHHQNVNRDYSLSIQKCCDYIDLNLERKIRLKDLAVLCGYSEYYLSEKFQAETGESINRYIRRKKLERAKLILETTSTPVTEIAELLAFNTVNYFIQCFRDAYGCTPAAYRAKSLRHQNKSSVTDTSSLNTP